MARRKELSSLANGILGSFISRNNDVDGYWGIGKLYEFALSQQTAEITVDLLTQEIFPESEQLVSIAQTYGQKLVSMLSAYGGCITWIAVARMVVVFERDSLSTVSTHSTQWGDPFTCTCRIVDDRGQRYSKTAKGYCRPHNADEERRRLRG